MSEKENFKVNDKVVYPSHGVGEIVNIEVEQIGTIEMNFFAISFMKDNMILRVPVKRARSSGLRHLSTRSQLDKVISILQARPKTMKGMWSRRAQEIELKINSGDVIQLAEVVRDLHKGSEADRSYSERILYESAVSRLAGEFAAVENMSLPDSIEMLMDVLREKEAA